MLKITLRHYDLKRNLLRCLVSNTVYKASINVTVDFTPLRRHPVNKDERTCTYTPILSIYSFFQSSNKDENLNKLER